MTGALRYRALVDLAEPGLSARRGDVLELDPEQAYRILSGDPAALVREPDAAAGSNPRHQWAGSNTR